MSTIRQKKLAKAIVENIQSKESLTAKDLLISAGYDETTANASSTRTLEQPGVVKELSILGFTEENAKSVVATIMNGDYEPNARLKAADMTFKVHGSYAPEKKALSVESIPLSQEKIDQINRIALDDEE